MRTVRDVIHQFNEIGLASPGHSLWGRPPRLLNRDDEVFYPRISGCEVASGDGVFADEAWGHEAGRGEADRGIGAGGEG